MKNKTVRDAMLPLGDVFMIDADSAMDKTTMCKVAYICLILFAFMLLYIPLKKFISSCHLPLLVKDFKLGSLFDVFTLYFRINQGFIVPPSIAKHLFGKGEWLPRILQSVSFNLTLGLM